jgi:hypothetical protein
MAELLVARRSGRSKRLSGIGIRWRSPAASTAPVSASVSKGRPATRSKYIEVPVRRIGQERRQHLHRFVSSKLRAVGTSNRSRLLPAKQVCRAELPEKGRPCRRYREAPVNRSNISRGESVLSWHLANLFWLCGTAISIRCRAL